MLMGSQQMKPHNEHIMLFADKQQYLPSKRNSNDAISQQARTRTVMYNQNISSISSPRQCITVADFAKIKIEPVSFDDTSEAEPLRKGGTDILNTPEAALQPEGNSVLDIQENCAETATVSQPTIELKKELLAAHDVSSAETVTKNDAILLLMNSENIIEVQSPIKAEVADECECIESNIVVDKYENRSKTILPEAENDAGVIESTKLVKNPLAFLKKNCDKIRNEFQKRCLNNTIKSEAKLIEEELEISSSWNDTVSSKYKSASAIKVESDLTPINFDELEIKSENFSKSETDEKFIEKSILYQTCISCNLDSSLDVNLSHENTDLDDASSKQLNEDAISNISLNTTPQSSKFFSILEISSEEENAIPVQKSELNKNIETRKKRKPYKKRLIKDRKISKKGDIQNKKGNKRLQSKRLARPKTKKYSSKDTIFKSYNKNGKLLKNLPKTAIKTRKNSIKSTAKKSVVVCNKAEFPKPFKLEPESLQKHQSVTVELPKPMMFKSELNLNSKNKQSYLKPEFQPFVRLKRLKSEELLVPLKTGHIRRARRFKGTSETRSDFLIQQAYSLNPCIKFNRLSMDYDNLYGNEQRALNSRFAASKNVLSDVANESVAEMETKYFSPRERFSFFQSSTPDGSSMFSGPIDSGISTSTPSTSHYSHQNFNKTLLLKIAAERAFINNHLIRFGFSPIQFGLYNNLNELNVFLKFLFGNNM